MQFSSCRRSTAGLSLLTLAALFTAPSAHAQGLTLGSTDGSPGSATIDGTGASVSGSYVFSGGASTATSAYTSVDAYGISTNASSVVLQAGASITSLTLHDDSQATVSGGSISTLTTGGNSVDYTIRHNTAAVNITGGTVGTFGSHSEGKVASVISGGTVNTVIAFSYSGSILNISGGSVGTVNLSTLVQTSQATVSGGSIQTFNVNGGSFNMNGGSIGSLNLADANYGHGTFFSSAAQITGGTVNVATVTGAQGTVPTGQTITYYDTCNISGGTFGTLNAANYGGYDIFGSDLLLSSSGYVTGFLSDGTAINALYANTDGNGFLKLINSPAAVPEASTTVSLGLLLMLGAGGLVLAKRRASVS